MRKGESPGMKRAGAKGVVVGTCGRSGGLVLEEQGKAERRGMAATDRQETCVGPDLGERTSAICQANQKIQKMGQRAGERLGWEKGRRVG